MNKTNSRNEKNRKLRKNVRIVGNYTASGRNAYDAFAKLMNEIYLRSDERGHRGPTKFLDKNRNLIDEPTFETNGGQFRGYFILEGEDINNIVVYLINGVVNKGIEKWYAMAEVSRAKISAKYQAEK
jgi:hypothetical protein